MQKEHISRTTCFKAIYNKRSKTLPQPYEQFLACIKILFGHDLFRLLHNFFDTNSLKRLLRCSVVITVIYLQPEILAKPVNGFQAKAITVFSCDHSDLVAAKIIETLLNI